MRKRSDSTQLDLELPDGKKVEPRSAKPAKVVPFIDAATLELRRNAVKRVAAAGVFYLDPRLR